MSVSTTKTNLRAARKQKNKSPRPRFAAPYACQVENPRAVVLHESKTISRGRCYGRFRADRAGLPHVLFLGFYEVNVHRRIHPQGRDARTEEAAGTYVFRIGLLLKAALFPSESRVPIRNNTGPASQPGSRPKSGIRGHAPRQENSRFHGSGQACSRSGGLLAMGLLHFAVWRAPVGPGSNSAAGQAPSGATEKPSNLQEDLPQ